MIRSPGRETTAEDGPTMSGVGFTGDEAVEIRILTEPHPGPGKDETCRLFEAGGTGKVCFTWS